MAFIDEHRGEYGVEPICEVLPIAPSTYFEQRRRALQPETRPEREKQDERLRLLIKQVWTENHEVYGARNGMRSSVWARRWPAARSSG